jgi:WAS family protein
MPLPKRMVEPVNVARGSIPEDFLLPSELEQPLMVRCPTQCVSCRHAEDLFGELQREVHGLAARASSLQTRTDRLAVIVTQLDNNVKEASLQDFHMRQTDLPVVSRDTMPTIMLETYQTCDKPPPLDKLITFIQGG